LSNVDGTLNANRAITRYTWVKVTMEEQAFYIRCKVANLGYERIILAILGFARLIPKLIGHKEITLATNCLSKR